VLLLFLFVAAFSFCCCATGTCFFIDVAVQRVFFFLSLRNGCFSFCRYATGVFLVVLSKDEAVIEPTFGISM